MVLCIYLDMVDLVIWTLLVLSPTALRNYRGLSKHLSWGTRCTGVSPPPPQLDADDGDDGDDIYEIDDSDIEFGSDAFFTPETSIDSGSANHTPENELNEEDEEDSDNTDDGNDGGKGYGYFTCNNLLHIESRLEIVIDPPISAGYAFVDFSTAANARLVTSRYNGVLMSNSLKQFKLNWASVGGLIDRR
ncbi:hypothetical protein MFLAVUS_006169 [Mucor flavus]|uniref:RRM domain-containing protein n=1 Tax=Mucor flavus TaxID=439312 RepID=A0ABP9Z0S0_9FUNG